MGYVKSTPDPAIEIDLTCPPFNIRCRWLAGKFILKSLAHSNHNIFDTFYSLFITWRYTFKSLPVLTIAANSPSNFHQYVIKSNKLLLYEQPYDIHLFTILVRFHSFSNFPLTVLKSMSLSLVNKYFSILTTLTSLSSILTAQYHPYQRDIPFIYLIFTFLSLTIYLLRSLPILLSAMPFSKPFYLSQI